MRKLKQDDAILNILKSELSTSKSNNIFVSDTYERGVSVIDGYRTNQKYKWQSDVNIPEFFSSYITESSLISNQYFQTRDFVEIYLEGDRPEDISKCEAAKRLINKILNRRELYHYHKLLRASAIRQLAGVVYAICWWEQEFIDIPEQVEQPLIIPSENMTTPPTISSTYTTQFTRKIIKDYFNYEVLDPRNVFVSPEYTYSIQDKQYVIVRHEKSIESLIADAPRCNYFNLDKLNKLATGMETETARESYNKEQLFSFPFTSTFRLVDVYERYGKFWAIVKDTDQFGNPTSISPGIDSSGNPLPNAVLCETIITFACSASDYVLIRFDPQRNIDSRGRPYRPIIRGLYYIHPSRSEGSTDTIHAINLQEALNDTINISNDRVMLATFPALKARKYAFDNVEDITISPNHPILLENPNDDLQELKISDNIQGAMMQTNLLITQLHQLRAIFPTTMGNLGNVKSSMTATAVAGAEQRADMRQSYKSMCFEYTFLTDLYWMILQMANQYMQQETAQEIFGDLLSDFDPDADYTYKPVTSAVELEQSKNNKIRNYMQMLQILSNLKHPEIIKIVDYIVTQILQLMGAEYSILKNYLPSPTVPSQSTGGAQSPESPPTTNQYGLEMTNAEKYVRGVKK